MAVSYRFSSRHRISSRNDNNTATNCCHTIFCHTIGTTPIRIVVIVPTGLSQILLAIDYSCVRLMSFLILSHVICHGAVVSCQNFFFPPTMEDEAIYAAMAVSRNVHARNERT